jgi:hypothetical protein
VGIGIKADVTGIGIPALAFRHPLSQTVTGALQYRTGPPYTGTGLVPDSALFFIPVPE